jgi:Ca2+-binding RTX toxin-like protein
MNDSTFLGGVNLSVPVIPLEWKIESLADMNGDGHVDILWRNSRTGENHLWYMDNATVLGGYNLSIASVSTDWEIVGTTTPNGWGGNDTIQTSLANYTLPEKFENLTLTGGASINGTGNEVANQLTGNSGDNTLHGLAGNDTIQGGDGNDTLYGDDGNDTISDFGGNDTINGGIGNDTLTDWLGNDAINGGDGDDVIWDHAGTSNTINGDAGNDSLVTSGGTNTINGGDGNDTITGGTGADTINGGDGEDSISEIGGANTISGGAGNDTLRGGSDIDTIDGGSGDDTIQGDTGWDILTGGAGADRFVWTLPVHGLDHITDYQAGAGGDVLDIAMRHTMELFSGQTITAANLTNYVQLSTAGGNTTISVDYDGAGTGWSMGQLVVLDGVTGLNLADLYNNGYLTVS